MAGALGIPAVSAASAPDKIVYLTFDDGPDPGNDPRLLSVLRKQQVPATFFLVGTHAASDPKAVRRLVLAGHAVGNHTYDHADLSKMSIHGVEHELTSTQRVLGPMAGNCMRPPYGAVSPAVTSAASALGLKVVLWNIDPEDWAHQNTGYIVNHVLTHVANRSVVLMHDGGGDRAATTRAVKLLIPQLRARGYDFRTVPACRTSIRGRATGVSRPVAPKPKPLRPTPASPTPTASTTPTVGAP